MKKYSIKSTAQTVVFKQILQRCHSIVALSSYRLPMNQNVGAQNPPGGEYAQRRGTQVHELEPSALLCRRDKLLLLTVKQDSI